MLLLQSDKNIKNVFIHIATKKFFFFVSFVISFPQIYNIFIAKIPAKDL